MSNIELDTWAENCLTCFLIYFRKASDLQRPISWMVYVDIWGWARYMAMAAPDLRECVPMLSAVKPRVSLPMALTVDLSVFRMDVDEI